MENVTVSEQEAKNAIEIWKKVVDVQQHFNDLEMRIRNFALTTAGVLIAAVGFTYQHSLQTDIWQLSFPSGLGLVAAAAFAWTGFFLMDKFWYHVLLKGAVKHAGTLEERYKYAIPGIDLGKTISGESGKVTICGVKFNSDRRLLSFYILGYLMLAVVGVTLYFAHSTKQMSAAVAVEPQIATQKGVDVRQTPVATPPAATSDNDAGATPKADQTQ